MNKIACIVMPTYNEAANLVELFPRIFEQQARIPTHEVHVLVVDDNSPDGTAVVVSEWMKQNPRIHLLRGQKNGLGEAYKRGIAHAIKSLDPELVLQMEADQQHDPALISLFVALTGYGFSVVIGSRFAPWVRMTRASHTNFPRESRVTERKQSLISTCKGQRP